MSNVITIFKSNMTRIKEKKVIIVMSVVVIPIMIMLAVFFTGREESKLNVALVSENINQIESNKAFHIIGLDKKPAMSDLLLNKYDAIVEKEGDNTYVVTSIKSIKNKEKIEAYFNSGILAEETNKDESGVGQNILGYISMFVLLEGINLMTLYSDDKKNKTFRRELITTANIRQYLFAHCLFTFVFIYLPTYFALVITKLVFRVEIAYSLWTLSGLLAILAALSTGFALFIASAIKKQDDGVLASSLIIIVTSILSGCFYSFTIKNKIMDTITGIIPQKAFLTLSNGLDSGKGIGEYPKQLIYLCFCIILFWVLGGIISKRNVNKGLY